MPPGSGSYPEGSPGAAGRLQRGSIKTPQGPVSEHRPSTGTAAHGVRGTPQPSLGRGAAAARGGGFGGLRAWCGQESGCRLSHRRSSAPSEQYWPSASLRLAHPSPRRHHAPAAAPCPAAILAPTPRVRDVARTGWRARCAVRPGCCTHRAVPVLGSLPQTRCPQRHSAHPGRGARSGTALGTGRARGCRGGSAGTVDRKAERGELGRLTRACQAAG